jgi:hypothetical protein
MGDRRYDKGSEQKVERNKSQVKEDVEKRKENEREIKKIQNKPMIAKSHDGQRTGVMEVTFQ